ncbi:MAG: hypothetical protein D6722_01325 [Bacteroidetes bacterium]|nr:MAG: hypothetical protein D6722_01325 [Bacteroidota bacterium]
MSLFTRILIILAFGGLALGAYAASVTGFGVGNLVNRKTRDQITQNCPDYYRSPGGDCLGRTFRSYYLVRTMSGGGFGGGK